MYSKQQHLTTPASARTSGYKLGPPDPLRGLKREYSKNSKKIEYCIVELTFDVFDSAESPLSIDAKSKCNDRIFDVLRIFAVYTIRTSIKTITTI